MVFNRGNELYLARPAPDLDSWRAERLSLPVPLIDPKDPEVSPDGELLVVADVGTSQMWALRWDPTAAAFVEPLELHIGSTSSPALRADGPDAVELLFNTNTRGGEEAHRASCTRTRS